MNYESSGSNRIDLGSRSKSEVITIRVNPKLKFGLEMLARLHNRSVSQTVEMAIQRVLLDPYGAVLHVRHENEQTDIIEKLWSPHRGERLLKMVFEHPELLSYEEQEVWNGLKRDRILDAYFEETSLSAAKLKEGANLTALTNEIERFWKALEIAEQQKQEEKRKAQKLTKK